MPAKRIPVTRYEFHEGLRQSVREIIHHFNKSQGDQNERLENIEQQFQRVWEEFDRVHVDLEAIKEMLVFRHELRNLVHQLKIKGIELDEARIFTK